MRIASFILGLLGAAGALLLGIKWHGDMSSPEAAAAMKLAEALSKEGGAGLGSLGSEMVGLQRATYALLACGALGLIASFLVLLRKGPKIALAVVLVVCGGLPLVFATKAIGGVLMVLAGLFAFFVKPKTAVA